MSLSRAKRALLMGVFCWAGVLGAAGAADFASYVNPFVGTDAHGHTFPGAVVPFGLVQASPDTRVLGWDACAGYHYSDSFIHGFSHTHLSGVGIPDYCDILVAPQSGTATIRTPDLAKREQGYGSHFSHLRERAEPGYYSVHLHDSRIDVELTTTQRVALHRYRFPDGEARSIVLDLEHRDQVLDAELRIISPTELAGYRRSAAWAKDQRIYFFIRFEQPFETVQLFSDGQPVASLPSGAKKLKALISLRGHSSEPVQFKVALSPTSEEGARRNLDAELPGWDFAATKAAARAAWNRVLGKIDVQGSDEAQVRTFYTALYHTYLSPNVFSDADGSYRGRDGQLHGAEHGYYTVFSLWDTYRAWHPLMTILEPTASRDFIRSFLLMYQQGGLLPVWDLAGNETFCMNGFHAAAVIADAYAKGIRGFDAELALRAMKHSASQDLFGLDVYRRDGYIGRDAGREGVSRTLEYAYDDWCVAQFAGALGHAEDRDLFLRRSQNYRHLFSPTERFFVGRENGGWYAPFNPREINFNYTEGNAWQWRFAVPHDLPRLIKLIGGDEAFGAALDGIFSEVSRTEGRDQADVTGLIGQYAQGNEPDHHVPYLYNFIGRPSDTQRRVRQILTTLYSDQPDGLCGNDDCGQMSAWYVLSALGFYPVTPGTDQWVIGSPLFDRAQIDVGGGRRFVVVAKNQELEAMYIGEARLNGVPLTRSYLTHAEILAGGTLELTMRRKPNREWATDAADRPGKLVPDLGVVAAPTIEVPISFAERATVTLRMPPGDGRDTGDAANTSTLSRARLQSEPTVLWYTLDGTDPKAGYAKRYEKPFPITESVRIACVAERDGRLSPIVRAEAHRADTGLQVTVKNPINPQYLAGGPQALVDGVTGGPDFTTGRWQGYEDCNLDVVVDLGRMANVRSVTVGFLQDANSYIFYPDEVRFEISADGVIFQKLETVRLTPVPRDPTKTTIQRVGTHRTGRGRYVRIQAPNAGQALAWGSATEMIKSFLFCDEIQIDRD